LRAPSARIYIITAHLAYRLTDYAPSTLFLGSARGSQTELRNG
jgi:hypothetical protein